MSTRIERLIALKLLESSLELKHILTLIIDKILKPQNIRIILDTSILIAATRLTEKKNLEE